MGEEFRTRPVNVTRNEATADARAKAVALNKNWNYIWFPSGGVDPSCGNDPSGRDPQDVSDLWRRGDDNGAEANATASGKAVICNKNINIVVY